MPTKSQTQQPTLRDDLAGEPTNRQILNFEVEFQKEVQ